MPISDTGLWYEWHGPEDGEILILSSGMGGSATYWTPNLSALSAGYRVLLYDHRGTGRSDRALPEVVTVGAMADDVVALMKELEIGLPHGRRPHFVGHALGGLIGLEVEWRSAGLGRLVIVNGWAELDPYFERCFDIRLEMLRKIGPEAYVRAQPLFLYPAEWISNNLARLEREAEHQLADFPPIETLEKRIAAAKAFDLWLDITGEVLVIGAADDMLVPVKRPRELAGKLAIGAFAEMKWGGHACNVTDPDTFNRIVLDFLRS